MSKTEKIKADYNAYVSKTFIIRLNVQHNINTMYYAVLHFFLKS